MQREKVVSNKVGRRGSRVKMLNNSSEGKKSLNSDAVKKLLREISEVSMSGN